MQRITVEVSSFLIEEGLKTGNQANRSVILKGLPKKSELSDVMFDRNRQIVKLTFDCEELDGDDRQISVEVSSLENA